MAKSSSLVEQAKASNESRLTVIRYSAEQIELALAWVANEVTISQVARVMKMNSTANAYPFLACALRQWMNEEKK